MLPYQPTECISCIICYNYEDHFDDIKSFDTVDFEYRSCLSGSIRLCGSLVVKVKGTDNLVNRLYKNNATWNGIYNGTKRSREWNNGFLYLPIMHVMLHHDSIWCRHNVRPIDCGSLWITDCRLDFFQFNRTWSNTTTRDQIYSDDTTTVIKCTYMNIASMQFVIDCLSCFFSLIAWKEEAAIRKKRKTRWR